MEQSFINPFQNFSQINKINDIKKEEDSNHFNFLKTMNLGTRVPEQKFDHYDQLYGHNKWGYDPVLNTLRPPPNTDYRHVSQLLQHTDNMMIDISGTLFKNKDLPIMKVRPSLI